MNLISESINPKALFRPGTLAAGISSDRVKVGGLLSLGLLISVAPGAITDANCNVTLKQYDLATLGNSAALKIFRYLHKKADQEVYTLVESEEGLDSVDLKALFTAAGGEIIIDVKPGSLDHETYSFVGCDISKTTAGVYASVFALAKSSHEPSYDLAI